MIKAGTVAAYLTLDMSDFAKGIAAAGLLLTKFAQSQSGLLDGVGKTIGGFGKTVVGKLEGVVKSVSSSATIASMPAVLSAKGAAAVQGWISGMTGKKNAAVSAAGSLMKSVASAADAVSFAWVGHNIVSGIVSGINAKKAGLMTTAKNLASSVSQTIRSALKINSPSRVMMEIGVFTAQGMEIGLRRGAQELYETASTVSRETAEVLAGASTRRYTTGEPYQWKHADDRIGALVDAIERLADAQSTVEIDGRSFGRLVREYV